MSTPTVEAGRLTLICADLDARPLFWTDADGERHGYEPAVASAVAAELGLALRWKFLRWSDFVPCLQAGDADAIWCGAAITPAREREMLFSRPYAVFDESVLVRASDPITQPEDLRGRRVGAIAGSTNMVLAETWPGCERIGFDGTSDDVFAEMIAALRNGDIDPVVDDEPAFGGLLADPELRLAFTVATGNRWGAALRLDNTRLKRALDSALQTLHANGSLRDSWQQWLPAIDWPGTSMHPG
ncbi:MAG: ABC transporter substrate-binding protein [Gammaproteobacteria bacterium]|nr:ABC transporter substrate-binding protein [Gammaproteobacteria bacterium]